MVSNITALLNFASSGERVINWRSAKLKISNGGKSIEWDAHGAKNRHAEGRVDALLGFDRSLRVSAICSDLGFDSLPSSLCVFFFSLQELYTHCSHVFSFFINTIITALCKHVFMCNKK